MSAVQYPFIDIAVHPRIRARLSGGEAIVIFSPDMKHALWANGRGAELFGHESIYDFLDHGTAPIDVSFRQADAAARGLKNDGDSRSFIMRVTNGFQRTAVQATCELMTIGHDRAIMIAAPTADETMSVAQCAARMIEGFDDTDTHRAVLDQNGAILAASPRFASLDLTPHTARMLVNMAAVHNEGLVKRPVPTRIGYLPAAMGRVSDMPAMHLLFIVEPDEDSSDVIPMEIRRETIGNEDVTAVVDTAPAIAEIIEPAEISEPEVPAVETPAETTPAADAYADTLDALADISEVDDEPTEEAEFEPSSRPANETTQTEQAMSEVRQALLDSFGTEPEAQDGDEAVASDDAEDMDEVDETELEADEDLPVEEVLADDAPVAAEEEDLADTAVTETVAVTVDEPNETPAQMFGTSRISDNAEPFVFSPDMRATRFVWKIDSEGRFSEVSSEFARVVGPHAADINGLAFSDLAALFNFDPDGKIAELLRKRDTWSGKTIWWPIEGTTLKVPVDLAALPTYTRSREFDGFRGFGIVRVADVAEDPLAIGVTLVPTPAAAETETSAEDATAESDDTAVHGSDDSIALLPETSDDDIPASADVVDDSDTATAADDAYADPAEAEDADDIAPEEDTSEMDAPAAPEEERPALRVVETPSRRHSDKVIQFEERRSRKDGLTPGEQAAFIEIARRLEPLTDREEVEDDNSILAPHANENAPSDLIEAAAGQDETAAEETVDAAEQPDDSDANLDGSSDAAEDGDEDVASEALPLLDQAETDADETDRVDAQIEEDDEDEQEPEAEEPATYADIIPVRARLGLSAEILDQMPVALIVHAGDRLFHANPEFLRLTGYESLDQLDELGGLDVLLQRDELEAKTAEAGGMVVVRADDTLVPVSARLQSIRWEQSTALMLALMPVAVVAEPVPAAVQTAAETVVDEDAAAIAAEVSGLKVEVDELRSILETATDGVVIIGSEGDVRSMNRAASALFNYDNDETAGRPFVMLFAHESQRSVIDYLGGLSGHGVASVLNDGREVIGREAGGGFLPLFMTIGRLTSSNGYCAVIRDITAWKRTEEELRNAKRAAETANAHKSDFLAHVSHEIRTPLNAIIGFADMMATERFGPIGHPRYVEYANDIGRSGRHVLDIVNDLLDISKIEAGEMDLEFEAVGLNETVSEAVSIIQPQANGQRVIIRTALSQAVPQVVADLRSIKQIVLNLLSNAIRFTPSGGQIVVSSAFEANGNVILRIRDTGIGMTRSELELAMKPFRQVTGAARKRGDGTGLGLPLTKAMVDANRASFAISSTPNEGTLVEITFPSPRVLAN
ncbi:ATP-binding protein [Neorhizobium sp. BT27B]|uniref:PAS domain-containing sensor histidine kinase n=1 Tax=Neorhizobium sp. BT27B TaxID=3142625 RepID=UPI003D2C406C